MDASFEEGLSMASRSWTRPRRSFRRILLTIAIGAVLAQPIDASAGCSSGTHHAEAQVAQSQHPPRR